MKRNNRGRSRWTSLVIRYQNSEFSNFFLKSRTTYLIPKKRSKWKNHEITGKKAEILWKIEKQESLKRDPRVPLRGQKEKFTLNSAARTLRIRAHSNEPSHPCCPVNIFFSRFRLFVFFNHLGAERGVCKAIFNPFHATLHASFFFFCSSSSSTHWPLCLLFFVLFFLLPIQQNPRRNYAGFSSGDTGRGAGNKTKPGVTRCLRKKKGLRSFFFAHFLVRVASLTVSRLPSHFDPRFWFLHSLSYSSVRRSSAFLWDIFYARFDEALEPFDLEPVFHVTIAGTAKTNEHLRNFP